MQQLKLPWTKENIYSSSRTKTLKMVMNGYMYMYIVYEYILL